MKNTITIREYETKDSYKVINLIKLNIPKYFSYNEAEDFQNYLKTKRELYYVVLLDEKIVGCGGINFSNNFKIGKISWDIFHPEYQGKSLGTKLVQYRVDKLKSMEGIEKIVVRTSQFAYKFYKKHGFELIEIKIDYWGSGFDLYNMEYNLK